MCRRDDYPPFDPPRGICMMRGHAERGCNDTSGMIGGQDDPLHADLCRAGVGFSRIPGPSASELDREVMASEFHGRHPGAHV